MGNNSSQGLRLRPYKACDAHAIVQWCKDEYAFRQWSADRYAQYPISAEDMQAYYERDRNSDRVWAMTAFDDTGVVGHFTMRYPHADDRSEIRLGFVIVDDRKRGMGYGSKLLELAKRYAFEFLRVEKITLGVFENNVAAIRCYYANGFTSVERSERESYECLGERWNCIEMECRREGNTQKQVSESANRLGRNANRGL